MFLPLVFFDWKSGLTTRNSLRVRSFVIRTVGSPLIPLATNFGPDVGYPCGLKVNNDESERWAANAFCCKVLKSNQADSVFPLAASPGAKLQLKLVSNHSDNPEYLLLVKGEDRVKRWPGITKVSSFSAKGEVQLEHVLYLASQ